jgi:diguanylate cyclase (GGDEF)-like protein
MREDSTKKTILLLDNDPDFRQLVVPLLVERRFKVVEAATADSAWQLFAREKPHLVVVDGQLPDSDGLDWIKTLRDRGYRTPVVFISAFWRDQESYRQLTDQLNVSLLLHKPVIPAVFVEQIHSELKRAEGEGIDTPSLDLDPSEALAVLRRDYGNQLPGRLKELTQSLELARKRNEDQFLLGQARVQAHKLRGTAGSYGFADVGEASGKIEDALVKKPIDWAEIEQGLATIEAAAALFKSQEPENHTISDEGNLALGAVARLLVVDDDENCLKLTVALARQQQVDVIPAGSAAEALQMAAHRRPDAALIDLQLSTPEESFELARSLRALPGFERLPVAFMSANPKIYNRVAAGHAGASLFLDKPLEPDVFKTAVHSLVAAGQSERPRILLVDDDPDFCRRVATLLTMEGMIVHTLDETIRLLDLLPEISPDLLMLDVMMPGISGFDLCRMVRTIPQWQNLPIVFITAHTGLEARMAAFQAGADDYLPKPVIDEELVARIKVRLERARLMQERYEKDALTGLLTRRAFVERLVIMLSEAKRHNSKVAVAMLDLDHFKQINDTHGHLAGDNVLAGIGRLFQRRFRMEDLRGRWGGEELILAFRSETKETAHGVVDRVLSEFKEITFQSEAGEAFFASFSAGLASFPEDGETAYDLTKKSDSRLYNAKKTGRSKVVSQS